MSLCLVQKASDFLRIVMLELGGKKSYGPKTFISHHKIPVPFKRKEVKKIILYFLTIFFNAIDFIY